MLIMTADAAMAMLTGAKADLVGLGSGKIIGSKIPSELREKIENHLIFKPLIGDPAHGHEASILIDLAGLGP
jgi:hypothetical protein